MSKPSILIADSGSTKTSWCLLSNQEKKIIKTHGISPYFLTTDQISEALKNELLPEITVSPKNVDRVYFYGTGLAAAENAKTMKELLEKIFENADVHTTHDLMGAAHGLCGHNPGIACILGTGSGACFFNGDKIVKSSPGLGFILGDEGSGAYLGKKVVQHYLYHIFDRELMTLFDQKYATNKAEILEKVYQKPFPNRYLASFSYFLSENRGHEQVEKIIEEGINDFFTQHISKYRESKKYPVHFTGGATWAFKDVVKKLCLSHGVKAGNILKAPIEGLIRYHKQEQERSDGLKPSDR